jgi:hypothetical protein
MAARRVSPGYLATAVLLSLAAAVATFQLKYAVRDLERDLAAVRAQIVEERDAIQSARADLGYLTRPGRLVRQAVQVGMVPARGGRLLQAGQLPGWEQLQWAKHPMPAMLPSGAAVTLRSKPLPLLAGFGMDPD